MAIGGLSACLGVALGAFGAHALKAQLSVESLAIYQTGVQYQQLHALAILFVALAAAHIPSKRLVAAGWLFAAGTVVFSGSLYALAITGVRVFGAITPLGGVCFLSGWALLTWEAVASRPLRS